MKQEREIMSSLKFENGNIELLQEIRESYFNANKPIEDDKSYLIDYFMIYCILELKDLRNEINKVKEFIKESK